jgi:hypothetical protein
MRLFRDEGEYGNRTFVSSNPAAYICFRRVTQGLFSGSRPLTNGERLFEGDHHTTDASEVLNYRRRLSELEGLAPQIKVRNLFNSFSIQKEIHFVPFGAAPEVWEAERFRRAAFLSELFVASEDGSRRIYLILDSRCFANQREINGAVKRAGVRLLSGLDLPPGAKKALFAMSMPITRSLVPAARNR